MQEAKVIVYTLDNCPYCKLAKDLLDKRGIVYEEINFTLDPELREEIAEKSGMRTAPQVFVDGRPIGGFENLKRLDAIGELARIARGK